MYGLFHLWLIHPEKQMCTAFEQRFQGLPQVKVIQSEYQKLPPHDCFVTAGNAYGIMTAGIDAVVVDFFGRAMMEKVQHRILDEYLGEQPLGSAFIESTDREEYPFLAHAPTMKVPGSIEGTDNVYRATWAALLAVNNHNLKNQKKIETLVFPALGTGFGRVPYDEAARQMAVAYQNYLNPPHRLDWDLVIARQKALCYDQQKRVLKL
jgi:O-acetyl-ADP-ribose deacetylase (regulator of RNase III)